MLLENEEKRIYGKIRETQRKTEIILNLREVSSSLSLLPDMKAVSLYYSKVKAVNSVKLRDVREVVSEQLILPYLALLFSFRIVDFCPQDNLARKREQEQVAREQMKAKEKNKYIQKELSRRRREQAAKER